MAKGYVVLLMDVEDPERYAAYSQAAGPVAVQYGGRALVKSSELEEVEGTWPVQRIVILEFDSREAARAWYLSPEYQRLLPDRLAATDSRLVFVDGFTAPGSPDAIASAFTPDAG